MNSTFKVIKRVVTAVLILAVVSCSGGDNTPTGTITVYADNTTRHCTGVRVSVDTVDIGPVVSRVPAPTCGDVSDPRAITRYLKEGTHTLTATNGDPSCTWPDKDYLIIAKSCTLINLFITPDPIGP